MEEITPHFNILEIMRRNLKALGFVPKTNRDGYRCFGAACIINADDSFLVDAVYGCFEGQNASGSNSLHAELQLLQKLQEKIRKISEFDLHLKKQGESKVIFLLKNEHFCKKCKTAINELVYEKWYRTFGIGGGGIGIYYADAPHKLQAQKRVIFPAFDDIDRPGVKYHLCTLLPSTENTRTVGNFRKYQRCDYERRHSLPAVVERKILKL